MTELQRVHRCQFCGKTFARKSWFLRHSCAKKRKFEETNDVVAQQAYRVWLYWMKQTNSVKRGKEPDFDRFLKSPMKAAFVRIMIYCREQGISSPYTYIDWLMRNRIRLDSACNDDVKFIDAYKEFTNTHEDPEDQALFMVNEIEKWILDDPDNRTPQQYYDKLSPGTILTMVRNRKMRPWVMLTYPPIAEKWLDDTTYNPDVFYRIDDMINCAYWAEKIENDPDAVSLVKDVMDQLWEYQT